MNHDFKSIELIKSPNEFHHDAGLKKARADVCSKIIQILDDKKLSARDAEKLTGISHTEFSRIRNAKLQRFTLDRLIIILGKLAPQIKINISFDTRPVVNPEPKAIEGIYESVNEDNYSKNLAGHDISIFLYRFEVQGIGILGFVINEDIAEDMSLDIADKIMPLVQSCCETLSHYQHLVKIGNTIMDGNILTNNDFEVMLSKGLGQYFRYGEKAMLFQNAKEIADLLLTIVKQIR
jgi:predicted XRE-type DNA-binding protein